MATGCMSRDVAACSNEHKRPRTLHEDAGLVCEKACIVPLRRWVRQSGSLGTSRASFLLLLFLTSNGRRGCTKAALGQGVAWRRTLYRFWSLIKDWECIFSHAQIAAACIHASGS
jgi:hypothetical protein